jgi:glycosyltransferase involved in cell wall biosynthesis
VSIVTVIPAYNEGDRLAAFLADWAAVGLSHPHLAVTAIVVDDGSKAEMAAAHQAAVERVARELAEKRAAQRIDFVRADRNRGKGAAIRLGWNHAAADASWLTFIDADGAIPAREYWRMASLLPATEADVVCACRIKMAGRTIDRTLFRHFEGRLFATFAEELFHLGYYDTQTGMKAFRASMLRPILSRLREDRWMLDVELLVLMHQSGARAIEVPIDCYMRGPSSLAFGLDPLRMGVQLVKLRSRLGAGTASPR